MRMRSAASAALCSAMVGSLCSTVQLGGEVAAASMDDARRSLHRPAGKKQLKNTDAHPATTPQMAGLTCGPSVRR